MNQEGEPLSVPKPIAKPDPNRPRSPRRPIHPNASSATAIYTFLFVVLCPFAIVGFNWWKENLYPGRSEILVFILIFTCAFLPIVDLWLSIRILRRIINRPRKYKGLGWAIGAVVISSLYVLALLIVIPAFVFLTILFSGGKP
jgi:hypothetical protein